MVRIQLRRDTAANWTSSNPVLRAGEVGIETDTLKFKVGNGTSTWTQITAYANVTSDSLTSSLSDYIESADLGQPSGPAQLTAGGGLLVPEDSVIMWSADTNTYTTTLVATEPTADRTITLKDGTGTLAFTSDIPSNTDSLSEGSTNKYFTDERAQDAVSSALSAGTHTNITVTYDDSANSISLAAAPGYVDEQAVDAVAAALAAGTHTNITVGYNDNDNSISLTGAVTYTDENAQDAIGNAVGTGLSYNDSTGAISVDTTTIQARVTDVSDTEIGYLNGVTSAIQAQINDKAPLSSPVFTGGISITNGAGVDSEGLIQAFGGLYVSGDTTIDGDLLVNGVSTSINTTNTSVADNMIYLNEAINYTIIDADGDGTNQVYTTSVNHDLTTAMVVRITGMNPAGYNKSSYVEVTAVTSNTFTVLGSETGTFVAGGIVHGKSNVNPDLGISGGYNDGTYHHAGMFRDASDGKWKFFQGYEPEPSGAFINTSDASFELAPLKVAGFEATEASIGNVTNTELQYVHGVTSSIQDQLDDKAATVDIAELAQDAVGNNVGTGLTYNDTAGAIGIDNAGLTNFLLDGASGSSYGLIGTSTYLDVKNTNGYNKEIELDIAAVESKLDTDGYITTSSTSTLTNKTLTSPKINENVALTATATELNYVDGVTSAIQDQIDAKIAKSLVDAKGDLLVGTADNTVAKIGIGTDGYLLTADSSTTEGLKWAAAPVSLPSQTGENGKYLTTDGSTASWATLVVPIETGTATVTANTATTVDTTALSAFTSIEYMVSLKQGSKVRTSKVVVQTDGTSVDMTEFAITETGGTIAGVVISAAVSSTNGVLQVTATDATSTNVTVKFSKVKL